MDPDETHRLSDPFCLPVDPEVVKAKEAAQENPRLLVTCDHNGGRRRSHVAVHSDGVRDGPGPPRSHKYPASSSYF